MDSIINFEKLEKQKNILKKEFLNGVPYEAIVLDDFCDAKKLTSAVSSLPDMVDQGVNKSRDFIFAKNKFEKSNFNEIHPVFAELKKELCSTRFESLLKDITGESIFIDPEFHGGGLHQGGKGSFLDMHADFNYHPINKKWFRNINILLYLNKDWEDSFGGELKLIDARLENAPECKIAPLFNRAVIMFTREYTLHGYDIINFPEGKYRRSIAAYGYTLMEKEGSVRTTVWYPERGGPIKKIIGKYMPYLVKLKSKILGSGTVKNK